MEPPQRVASSHLRGCLVRSRMYVIRKVFERNVNPKIRAVSTRAKRNGRDFQEDKR